ncbi:MAG: hypothetical protein Q4F56_00100 [Candidatus Saccharibacteria bacterium]|nr:hypothetical protein [Candidatus Saccharibacteria bacterium]
MLRGFCPVLARGLDLKFLVFSDEPTTDAAHEEAENDEDGVGSGNEEDNDEDFVWGENGKIKEIPNYRDGKNKSDYTDRYSQENGAKWRKGAGDRED